MPPKYQLYTIVVYIVIYMIVVDNGYPGIPKDILCMEGGVEGGGLFPTSDAYTLIHNAGPTVVASFFFMHP